MKCPKCKAPLEKRSVDGGVTADACFNCYGVFYDPHEVTVPLQLENMRVGTAICPKDGATMGVGTMYGGKLELDQCSRCGGFWFDGGEIASWNQDFGGLSQVASMADNVNEQVVGIGEGFCQRVHDPADAVKVGDVVLFAHFLRWLHQ